MIDTRLLYYDITSQLGEGGMGVVYQATDTRLNRQVAIKVLPEAFVADAERLARFQREAQLLAALNHPNIGGIHGLEESGPTRFLVLELIPGETLSEQLGRGAMPVDKTLPLALQLTQALEAAHGQGIIHRDLKPDNIKITPEGQLKVLDFGLAKAWDQPADSGLTQSPTLTAQMTQAGVILGTASYMSPEQARGQEVDKRADIWSFGVVLYEMLVGGRIYSGETVTDILGAIVHKEPDWERLPANLPASIERLLKRCLEKNKQRRLQDIGDVRIEIEDAIELGDEAPLRTEPASASASIRLVPWALAAVALLLAFWALTTRSEAPPAEAPYARYTISLDDTRHLPHDMGQAIAISPDGSRIVYAASDGSQERLYLRERQDSEATPIPGTEGAHQVTFSPDGRWIAFRQASTIHKLPLDGGAPQRLAPQSDRIGFDWSDQGEIVYSPDWGSGLYRVPVDGGEPQEVTRLDTSAGDRAHFWPDVLPGGRAVLFTIWNPGDGGETSISVAGLPAGEHKVLISNALAPRYSPTGHLLFVRSETLMAVPFDPERLEVTGEPVPIQNGVRYIPSYLSAIYDISDSGTLVFQAGGTTENLSELVWVSPAGEVELAIEDRRAFREPAISPDGRRLGVTNEGAIFQIWMYDLATGTRSQLTHESDNGGTAWMPGGREIIFWSARVHPYGVFRIAADGSSAAEIVYHSKGDTGNVTISPDGRVAVFEESVAGRSSNLMAADLEGEANPRPFRANDAEETFPQFSPDGRWVAYQSTASGRSEVYVAPFPGPGSSWLISAGGGTNPRWSPDGRQLFYRDGDRMLAVDVETGDELRAQRPKLLFELPGFSTAFDVARDREGFLMIRRIDPDSPDERRIEVALNWPQRLERED